MILYHTSSMEVPKPDIRFSRSSLDFGVGFYTTENKSQAEKYGRRFIKQGVQAVLNTYNLDDDISEYNRKVFLAYNAEWLDYVELCRREIGRLIKKKPNWQICLANQALIDLHLHFVESIKIE